MTLATVMQGAATAITVMRAIRMGRNLFKCPGCGQMLRGSAKKRRRNG